jgi:hypothetical protein
MGRSTQCIDDPCDGEELDCSLCARPVCASIGAEGEFFCNSGIPMGGTKPIITCSGGGICASPDTLVGTPYGDVPIADLREGDIVYSQDQGLIVRVPVIAVIRRPVARHSVVHLVLDDGTELFMSGPHPTADGRTLQELSAGDLIDGRRVLAAQLVPYPYDHTYDVLPGSRTGQYLANGVWVGSTLLH